MFSRLFNIFGSQPQPVNGDDIYDAAGNDVEYADLEEVVVDHPVDDNAEEVIAPKVWPPSLQQQIAEFEEVVDEGQVAANDEFKPHTSKFYLYTALFLMVSATAIIAPTTLIAIFRNSFYRQPEYSPEDAQKLHELELQRAALGASLNVLQDQHDSNYEKLYAVIGQYYDRWFAKDAHGINCATGPHPEMVYMDPDVQPTMMQLARHYTVNLLCIFANELKGLSSECQAIAEEGCNATRSSIYFRRIESIDYQWTHAWSEQSAVNRTINKIQQPYLDVWANTNLPLIGLAAGVSIVSAIGLIVAGKKYWNNNSDYRAARNAKSNIQHVMPDVMESADVVQLLTKLNIAVDDQTTFEDVLHALHEKSAEIEYRWKQRTAFLGIAKRPESELFRFFHNGVMNHDIQAKILDMANLGPRPRL